MWNRIVGLTFLWLIFAAFTSLNAPVSSQNSQQNNNYVLDKYQWVEQTLSGMSLDERIGQLFMVAAYTNRDEGHKQYIASLIKNHHIGGLIFFQDDVVKQVQHTNYYQSISKTPLLMAIDAEWGLSMRLKGTPKFPRQLTLGAIRDNQLIFEMGKELARQSKRIGVHVNFAPVVDVNNNPNNPVINDRSFGEDKYNVAGKGVAYMQGMEMNGIIACAKHFPGHGDTDADSHYTTPVIKHDAARLNDIELYPFKEMFRNGVGSVMVAHLAIPALDDTPMKPGSKTTMPTTLSQKVVTDLLKNHLDYKGLVFTDAMNMKGVSSHFAPGDADVRALVAGNDVILFPENVSKGIIEVKKALERGDLTEESINERVRKVLQAKYRVGLAQKQTLSVSNVKNDLNTPEVELLKRKLYENALTLARDDRRLIPFQQLNQRKFASLAIGESTLNGFQKQLNQYTRFSHHTLRKSDSDQRYNQKLQELKAYNTVVVSVHSMSKYSSKNHGINQKAINLIKRLEQEVDNVVVVLFGSPYALKYFDNSKTTVVAYEDNSITQNVAAQALFGGVPMRGRLPVTASDSYRYGGGISTAFNRFKYTIPEEIGIRSEDLAPIDRIVENAIKMGATPGCQVFVAKDGKVIFNKSYGHHTYNRIVKVQNDDLYDLASLTKIAASALATMELYESQRLNLTDPISRHLPELQGTNKANMTYQNILTHEAGLRSWIPFYEATMPTGVYNSVYQSNENDRFNLPVADNMFMDKSYVNTIYQTITQDALPNKGKYRYSDLGYFYMLKVFEKEFNDSLDDYLNSRYYGSMGLSKLTYQPSKKFSKRSIIPTEKDNKWRKQVVHGHVHDMGAAMLGGVAGHAGLFSNANDLGVLMQMYLNEGTYGGIRYFNPQTVNQFTKQQKKGSRRALIFDRPDFTSTKESSFVSKKGSYDIFGHSGFTGTCAWADPKHNLVYVFLSNRTYPGMSNYKLIKDKTRTKIHNVVYDAIARADARVVQGS